MKFTTAITTAVLATGALAAPRPGLAERLEARGVLTRQSVPAHKFDNSGEENSVLLKEEVMAPTSSTARTGLV